MKSKKLKSTFVGIGIITFFITLSFLVGYIENDTLAFGKAVYEEPIPTSAQPILETKKYKDTVWLDYSGNVNKYRLTSSIHEMCNSIVVADLNARWDAGKITQDEIDRVYDTAYALDINDKDRAGFIAIAERWKKHDFSKAVEDHNFVWGMLGGSIGKATEINEEALKETLERLKQENIY
jgi:hypothetical protein